MSESCKSFEPHKFKQDLCTHCLKSRASHTGETPVSSPSKRPPGGGVKPSLPAKPDPLRTKPKLTPKPNLDKQGKKDSNKGGTGAKNAIVARRVDSQGSDIDAKNDSKESSGRKEEDHTRESGSSSREATPSLTSETESGSDRNSKSREPSPASDTGGHYYHKYGVTATKSRSVTPQRDLAEKAKVVSVVHQHVPVKAYQLKTSSSKVSDEDDDDHQATDQHIAMPYTIVDISSCPPDIDPETKQTPPRLPNTPAPNRFQTVGITRGRSSVSPSKAMSRTLPLARGGGKSGSGEGNLLSSADEPQLPIILHKDLEEMKSRAKSPSPPRKIPILIPHQNEEHELGDDMEKVSCESSSDHGSGTTSNTSTTVDVASENPEFKRQNTARSSGKSALIEAKMAVIGNLDLSKGQPLVLPSADSKADLSEDDLGSADGDEPPLSRGGKIRKSGKAFLKKFLKKGSKDYGSELPSGVGYGESTDIAETEKPIQRIGSAEELDNVPPVRRKSREQVAVCSELRQIITKTISVDEVDDVGKDKESRESSRSRPGTPENTLDICIPVSNDADESNDTTTIGGEDIKLPTRMKTRPLSRKIRPEARVRPVRSKLDVKKPVSQPPPAPMSPPASRGEDKPTLKKQRSGSETLTGRGALQSLLTERLLSPFTSSSSNTSPSKQRESSVSKAAISGPIAVEAMSSGLRVTVPEVRENQDNVVSPKSAGSSISDDSDKQRMVSPTRRGSDTSADDPEHGGSKDVTSPRQRRPRTTERGKSLKRMTSAPPPPPMSPPCGSQQNDVIVKPTFPASKGRPKVTKDDAQLSKRQHQPRSARSKTITGGVTFNPEVSSSSETSSLDKRMSKFMDRALPSPPRESSRESTPLQLAEFTVSQENLYELIPSDMTEESSVARGHSCEEVSREGYNDLGQVGKSGSFSSQSGSYSGSQSSHSSSGTNYDLGGTSSSYYLEPVSQSPPIGGAAITAAASNVQQVLPIPTTGVRSSVSTGVLSTRGQQQQSGPASTRRRPQSMMPEQYVLMYANNEMITERRTPLSPQEGFRKMANIHVTTLTQLADQHYPEFLSQGAHVHSDLLWSDFHLVEPSTPLHHNGQVTFYRAKCSKLEADNCILMISPKPIPGAITDLYCAHVINTQGLFSDRIPADFFPNLEQAKELYTLSGKLETNVALCHYDSVMSLQDYMVEVSNLDLDIDDLEKLVSYSLLQILYGVLYLNEMGIVTRCLDKRDVLVVTAGGRDERYIVLNPYCGHHQCKTDLGACCISVVELLSQFLNLSLPTDESYFSLQVPSKSCYSKGLQRMVQILKTQTLHALLLARNLLELMLWGPREEEVKALALAEDREQAFNVWLEVQRCRLVCRQALHTGPLLLEDVNLVKFLCSTNGATLFETTKVVHVE